MAFICDVKSDRRIVFAEKVVFLPQQEKRVVVNPREHGMSLYAPKIS